jgi:hypothetical protein
MKKILVAALIAGSFISFEARAQNRAGDAALGAVSGAVVLGPVGAVAGAVIGYTAGPSIARSWGVGRSASRSRAQRAAQSSRGTQETGKQELGKQEPGKQELATQEQATATVSSPPPMKSPETPSGKSVAPPVQGFDWEALAVDRQLLQKNLTRRANHRHMFIIARIEPAPGNRSRVFSIVQQ